MTIVRKIFLRELKKIFITDVRRALFLLGASLAYLVLFSILYSPNVVTRVPLVIYDEDQTQFSRALVQAFDDSEKFNVIEYVNDEETMEQLLRDKTAYAAVHIPQHFARDAKSGHSSSALVLVDGANIIITNTVTGAAQEIVAAFSGKTASTLIEAVLSQQPDMAVHKAAPINFSLRVLNNPTQGYLPFFVIGLAMAALQQGIFLSIGASVHDDFNSARDFAGAAPAVVLGVKVGMYFILAVLAFLLTMIVGVELIGLPFKTALWPVCILALAFIFAAIGLGIAFAAFTPDELAFSRVSIAYTVPAFVLSGYTWPQAAMDTLTQMISYLFPMTYISNTIRELITAGYSPQLFTSCLVLTAMGAACMTAAGWWYCRRLGRLKIQA